MKLYPGRIAAIKWYTNPAPGGVSSPLYTLEGFRRYRSYPLLWTGSGWGWISPWLYVDGSKHAGEGGTKVWRDTIIARLSRPAYARISMWGSYSKTRGSGTIYAKYINDSTGTMSGVIRFMIVEDSIFYKHPVPSWNGESLHYDVTRDFLPDTGGTSVTIPAGDSVTLSRAFTVQPTWNENKCRLITWFQKPTLTADSVRPVYNAGLKMVRELIVDIDEGSSDYRLTEGFKPNPCVNGTMITFSAPPGNDYAIRIYDVCGRPVREIISRAITGSTSTAWDLKNNAGDPVEAGVYLFRLEGTGLGLTGKIVVR